MLSFWRGQVSAQKALYDARSAEQEERYAYAIGKYKKAYHLDPGQKHLPLKISRLYCLIAERMPGSQYERDEAIFWLYRARLVDPDFSTAALSAPPFSILKDVSEYQLILANNPAASRAASSKTERFFMPILQRLQEIQAISVQMGQILKGFYRLTSWLGFQVIFFLILVFGTNVFLRFVGFQADRGLWALAFVGSIIIWHLSARVISGGQSGGWLPVFQVAGMALMFFLGLQLFKVTFNALSETFLRRWRRTSVYQTWRLKRPDALNAPNESLHQFIFSVEIAQDRLLQLGQHYLRSQSESERQELQRELQVLRTQIHRLTAEPDSRSD